MIVWGFFVGFLPPAYVVRREGTVFTGVCLSTGGEGGYPDPPPGGKGGVPDRVPPRGVPRPPGGVSDRVPPWGVPDWVPPLGTWTPPGGLPGTPRGGTWPGTPRGGGVPGPPRGGTQLGQHREYLLHRARYASCVHAGGLSCFFCDPPKFYFPY